MMFLSRQKRPAYSFVLRAVFFAVGLLFLSGCGVQQARVFSVMQVLDSSKDATAALVEMKKHEPGKGSKDRVHYLLNASLLKQVLGDVSGSISDINEAKRQIDHLESLSPTEFLGSISLSDSTRSYTPGLSERLLVYSVQITNYLIQGDLDAARVEVLQADELLKTYRNRGYDHAQLSNVYYMMGLVFELNQEWDEALISYRNAKKYSQTMPKALSDALVTASYKVGLKSEFKSYVREFGLSKQEVKKLTTSDYFATVHGVYWQGRVAGKISSNAFIFSPKLGHNVSLALPVYRPFQQRLTDSNDPYAMTHSEAEKKMVMVGGLNWQLIQDVNTKLKSDLDAQLPKLTARMLARAAVRHQAKKAYLEKNSGGNAQLGVFALDVLIAFLETADYRGWDDLPARIFVSRARVNAQQYAAINAGSDQGQQARPHSNYFLYKNDLAKPVSFTRSF